MSNGESGNFRGRKNRIGGRGTFRIRGIFILELWPVSKPRTQRVGCGFGGLGRESYYPAGWSLAEKTFKPAVYKDSSDIINGDSAS